MKKIYLLALFALPFLGLKAQTVPTCSLDPTFIHNHGEGIWPDSAINFVSGMVGQPYLQNITLNLPKDTTESGIPITFSSFNLTNTNYGLPPGLSLGSNPHPNFQFPANDSSCMIIYGTPTTAGTYSLTFVLSVFSTFSSSTPVATYTISYYHITIAAASAGIETNTASDNSFSVMQNSPNPITGNATNIKFTTPVDGKAKVSVYNITGQKVIDRDITTQRGENNYDFDATTLENGIYLYAVEFNGQKQVRRIVVAK